MASNVARTRALRCSDFAVSSSAFLTVRRGKYWRLSVSRLFQLVGLLTTLVAVKQDQRQRWYPSHDHPNDHQWYQQLEYLSDDLVVRNL